MKFDSTLFIEYFIIGGLAIIWIAPIFIFFGGNIEIFNLSTYSLMVSIAVIYIFGMLLDYFASIIFNSKKVKIRTNEFAKFNLAPLKLYEVLFLVAKNDNALILKHLERRNSRVRYARGALLNFIVALLVIPITFFLISKIILGIAFTVILILLVFLTWKMLEKMLTLSYEYQALTIKHLKNKI